VAVVKDKDGKSTLLKQGRYILQAPAVLLGNGNARGQQLVISLVNLPKQLQVDRYAFFNVPQGEVAGTTCPNGQVSLCVSLCVCVAGRCLCFVCRLVLMW